ncbi:hypothetical protein BJ944DRAFT_266498 [Cunninghamella echinulata]|nr:hypothetical protein BJ944DRAFT_266498 [Cunninghamella echinulata]
MSDSENLLETIPVNIVIDSLKKQIEELKSLQSQATFHPNQPPSPGTLYDHESQQKIKQLEDENADLRSINAKKEYQIEMLLKTLDSYDKLYKK